MRLFVRPHQRVRRRAARADGSLSGGRTSALLLAFVEDPQARIWQVIILRKSVPGLGAVALARFITRVCREIPLNGAVNLLVSDSAELRRLNRRFRGKDKATDVLSFPPISAVEDSLAGDIAISANVAVVNARRLGHTAAEEVKILAVHGLLHLAGYDHETDAGRMARKEQALRKKLGLPIGLIARNGGSRARGRSR